MSQLTVLSNVTSSDALEIIQKIEDQLEVTIGNRAKKYLDMQKFNSIWEKKLIKNSKVKSKILISW